MHNHSLSSRWGTEAKQKNNPKQQSQQQSTLKTLKQTNKPEEKN